jgi:hypothetical protein
LKTDLVPLAPELSGRKPDLGRLDAGLFQSAAIIGELKPCLVRHKKVGSRQEEALGGQEKVLALPNEVGFQSAAARGGNDEVGGRHEKVGGEHDAVRGRHEKVGRRHDDVRGGHDTVGDRHDAVRGGHEKVDDRHDKVRGGHEKVDDRHDKVRGGLDEVGGGQKQVGSRSAASRYRLSKSLLRFETAVFSNRSVVTRLATTGARWSLALLDLRWEPYCAGCAQNPLMHLLLVSQQSADVTHLSETPEHVGGVLEQTSPPSPPDSQYPLQH